MDPSIIAQLMDLLRVNPYSTFFRSIGDLPNLEYQKICIKSDPGLDQRVFNAPTSSEVAAIWVENDDSEHLTPRDIFVFNHIGGSHLVQYYFGCYDPLQYPLLIPLRDIGWHQGIQRINKRTASVSANNCTTQLIDPHQSTSAEELLRREQQESFDEIVSAELPDKDNNLHLYTAVVKHMMHDPCRVLNPTNVCMKKNGCCKNNYPKQFVPNTVVGNDCFPIYKRCNNGRTAKIRGHDLDNRWVFPYNPYLLAMFDCHINVEICSTIKAVKYLYKYIYKGHDRVAFNLVSEQSTQQIDEIERFQSVRWIAPPEAMWRIFGFIINEVHLAVYSLHLHLENQHQVTFRAHENLTNVINSNFSAKSMLTEFFATNQVDQNAKKLLYKEFPEFYVWSQQYKMWTIRKKQVVIGRIVTANPFEGERYYLQMLLNHIRGPLSFDHLKTVNGILAPTFREAATMYGLLQRDDSLEECLYEASLYQMPFSLRRLFATILVYCNPTNPRDLWERFEQDMSADFQLLESSSSTVRTETLRFISTIFESMGRNINSFHLIDQNIDFDQDEFLFREIDDELAVPIPEEDLHASTLLNCEQQNAYNSIL
ncbi:uncharacterized protein LOC122297053 [Carya illinoinensis]|uniref:uncharacterized protein LOC122297053 n=1 Tax=Carya illinoinensis TaxID=32201 RepID=UPI001C721F57|nr:uncharacterized protein LOC122297053 [Carya illinoinensis]